MEPLPVTVTLRSAPLGMATRHESEMASLSVMVVAREMSAHIVVPFGTVLPSQFAGLLQRLSPPAPVQTCGTIMELPFHPEVPSTKERPLLL